MEKQRAFRYQTLIVALALVALVCAILGRITYFVENLGYGWSLYPPSILEFISFLIGIAPYVLFVIYLLKFHNQFKTPALVPVTFGLIAFAPLYSIIRHFIYGYTIYFRIYFRDWIFDILLIIAFALATVAAFKGFSKKVFLIIAIAVGLLSALVSIINLCQSIEDYLLYGGYLFMYWRVFTQSMNILGSISLYVSLLLFGLNNRIPAIHYAPSNRGKANAEQMNPEQALRILNDKFELGIITEEEYRAQRAKIISKL